MEITDVQFAAALRIAIAALIGLAVGLERQWSGHASGPQARFAGLRTFLMLGLLGGTAGLVVDAGHEYAGAAMIIGGAAVAIVAYAMAMLRGSSDLDGTTEVAAILVVALGALAGIGMILVAAGAGSVVVLVLNEKKRLHGAVGQLDQDELRGALQFAVLALVVLPILPEGPYLGWLDIRPRSLWIIVLLFCALNFAGFLAQRSAGKGRGYLLTGLLGGVISSTAITLGFAQRSRRDENAAAPLAAGVIAACTVLVPRVLVISAAINPPVAVQLLPFILPAGLMGAAAVAYAWHYGRNWKADDDGQPAPSWLTGNSRSPLRILVAIQLAIVFQLAIVIIAWVRGTWPVEGLYATAAVLGLTNADALTVSMSAQSIDIIPAIAARAIAIGILANTVVKLAISAVVGSSRFRLLSGGILLLVAISIAAPLLIL